MVVGMKQPAEELPKPAEIGKEVPLRGTGPAAFMALHAAYQMFSEKFPEAKAGMLRQIVTQG